MRAQNFGRTSEVLHARAIFPGLKKRLALLNLIDRYLALASE